MIVYKESDQKLYPCLKTNCFPRAIVPYYECQWCVKLNGLASGVVKRPNTRMLSGRSFGSNPSVIVTQGSIACQLLLQHCQRPVSFTSSPRISLRSMYKDKNRLCDTCGTSTYTYDRVSSLGNAIMEQI